MKGDMSFITGSVSSSSSSSCDKSKARSTATRTISAMPSSALSTGTHMCNLK